MKIDLKKLLSNQRFWIQEIHLYEFDPQIKINSKKYPLLGIQANENLDNPHASYKDGNEYKKISLDEIESVYVEGAHEERLKETLEIFNERE